MSGLTGKRVGARNRVPELRESIVELERRLDALGSAPASSDYGTRSVVPQLSAIGTKLLTGQSVTLGVASDSTADMIPNNGAIEWPRRLCDAIAAARPSARVQLHNWSDATQTYTAPTVVQAGNATSAILIDDGFGRVSANLIGSTADTVAGVWGAGNGSPSADGSVAALRQWDALSVTTPQQASRVTAALKVVTEATDTQQLRLAVAMGNSGLTGYGVYAMLQINAGGTRHFIGIKKSTPSGTNVDVVPLEQKSLGLVNNSPAPQDATMVLNLTGTTVTLTVTVGSTVTTVSGTVSQADLDMMGFNAGALGWVGTAGFRLDRLQVALPAVGGQTVNVYNGSRAGSTIGYQGARAAVMYGSGVTGAIDALIVASGINNAATTPSAYSTLMAENVALIRAQQPAAGIVLASQNPLYPPVTVAEIVRHGDRTAVLRGLAAANGWGYLPVFEAFTLAGGTLTSDGTHPNDVGSALWADVVWGAMAPLVTAMW